jgi:hypothetical protein
MELIKAHALILGAGVWAFFIFNSSHPVCRQKFNGRLIMKGGKRWG